MDNDSKTATSSLIAQRLANLLVGRALRSPKFRSSSYDKSTSIRFTHCVSFISSEALQFVRR